MTATQTTHDVIIAGAGPVGLFLACELGMRGISVLVLERDESPESPWKSKPLGLRGVNTLSVEAFYRRGMLDGLFEEERPGQIIKTTHFQSGGHFAGMELDANKFDLSRWKYRLPGPALLPGGTYLSRIDTILTQRAVSLGVTIQRGMQVTTASQNSNSVTVYAGGTTFQAKWLVACDGGRSVLRKEAGFEFTGTDPEFTGYIVACELEDPDTLQPGFQPTGTGIYITGQDNIIYLADFDGGRFDRSQSVTSAHFQTVLRYVSQTDVTVKAVHFASTYTDRARQATTYRNGRIFLAGDSAHIHSPLGAQGLNAGIGDAMNLGWKLAAAIQGTAPENLLDTYTQERHPIAAWVLDWTRSQVTALKPDAFGWATRKIIQDLINTTDGTNYFMDQFWGLAQRYDLGNTHPLVGSSVPDFQFADGSRTGTAMVHGKGLMIDFTQERALKGLAGEWSAAVEYIDSDVKDTLGLRALLVRPDGIVAWVAEDAPDQRQIGAVLRQWFGSAG